MSARLIAVGARAICPPALGPEGDTRHEPCLMHVRLATKVIEAISLVPSPGELDILVSSIMSGLSSPTWCHFCGFRAGHSVECPLDAYLTAKTLKGL